MKKFLIVAALLVAIAGVAQAEMDQAILSSSSVTTNVGTATETVKGEIFSIRLDVTAAKTQTVSIVTAEGETILSEADVAADATYYPTNGVGAFPIGVSSDLTMTVTPAAATTGTNVSKAIITYKK